MPSVIDRYYSEMQLFLAAMTERQYQVALQHCRTGLELTVPALKAMQKDYPGFPSIPFIGGPAAAAAAMYNDEKCFRLMDAVAEYMNPKVDERRFLDVGLYRRDMAIISAIRNVLEATPELTVDQLKERLDRDTQNRVVTLLNWMQKNNELVLNKEGKTVTIVAGPPTFKGVVTLPTFRLGENLANPLTRPLELIPDSDQPEDDDTELTDEDILPHDEFPLAAELRQDGVMETVLMRSGCWLMGNSKSKTDLSFTTAVIVKNYAGETMKKLVLDHKVVRAFSTYRRDQIVAIDSVLGIHVYDFEGNHVGGFSLQENPEFQSIYRRLGDGSKPTAIVRCVDVRPETGEILFTVMDRFWWFKANGELVCAFYLPYGTPFDSSTDVALKTGSEIALRDKNMIDIAHNWIYFAKFSDRDTSVFLSMYDGQFLRISPDGEFAATWDLPSTATEVLEQGDQLIVDGWGGLHFLHDGGTFETFDDAGGTFTQPTVAVGWHKREVSLFNMDKRKTVFYRMTRDIRAVYPKGEKIRVDMTTGFAELEA